jgi:hypothetical protein
MEQRPQRTTQTKRTYSLADPQLCVWPRRRHAIDHAAIAIWCMAWIAFGSALTHIIFLDDE